VHGLGLGGADLGASVVLPKNIGTTKKKSLSFFIFFFIFFVFEANQVWRLCQEISRAVLLATQPPSTARADGTVSCCRRNEALFWGRPSHG
jgi:hypothetical protein